MSFQCQKHIDSRPVLLVADDEPVVRDIVRSMAESAGYRVLLATNASEALRVCERSGSLLGAVLLDLHIPGMGQEATAQIQQSSPHARVLIITGGSVEDAAGCHAHDVLLKPFTISELHHAHSASMQGVA